MDNSPSLSDLLLLSLDLCGTAVRYITKMLKLSNIDYLIGNVDHLDRNELTEYEKELLAAARSSDERARRDALNLLRENKDSAFSK